MIPVVAAPPQLLLDANTLVGGSAYVDLGACLVSPDERVLAYSVDTTGEEAFELRFRDLDAGSDLPDRIPRSYYGGAWSADSRSYFYTVHDAANRPCQVRRHDLGRPAEEDVCVLGEADERFELNVRACRSGDVIVVWSASRDTSEVWLLDAHDPTGPARCLAPRRPGVEYHCEHVRTGSSDVVVIVTNDGATEFRAMTAPLASPGPDRWTELVPERPAERLERVDAFARHLVLRLRTGGSVQLRVLPLGGGDPVDVRCSLPAGTIALGRNERFDADAVTVIEQSHTHPRVAYELDLDTGARRLRHRQSAPGHDPDAYLSERISVPGRDGAAIPVTVVRRADVPLDGTAPALMYGYGAYEYSFEPEFDPALPSLLDRGVVFVHAHVRGGGEGGRRWWLQGRLEHKQNTFSDHLAVADAIAGDLVDGRRIASRGLSAGGLLQGAVLSQRPGRWRAVVAEVPFVDVVTTMLDPSIPLTVNEWDEWGDPRRAEDFGWMLAYSPYDNLPPPGGRPSLLVTGAIHDPRVMVWEPAKWVAALRASDPEWAARCLFRCELGEGSHAGPSGRYAALDYEAEIYAWLLATLGVGEFRSGDP
jgi:oligopeptidase B